MKRCCFRSKTPISQRSHASWILTDNYLWVLVSLWFGLGIIHPFYPLETDLRVIVSSFRVRIVPFRGGIRGLICSIGGGWSSYYRWPTVCRYALDRSHHRSRRKSRNTHSWRSSAFKACIHVLLRRVYHPVALKSQIMQLFVLRQGKNWSGSQRH